MQPDSLEAPALRGHSRSLTQLLESFGHATGLKRIILAFLGQGTWLNSATFQIYPKILKDILDYSVWIHHIIPSANWKSSHSLLGVTYDHEATTPAVFLLGSRLAAVLAYIRARGYVLTASVYPKFKYLNSSCGELASPRKSAQFTYSGLRLRCPLSIPPVGA